MTDSMKSDFDKIPGTVVFDSRKSRLGLGLNRMCGSLNDEQNREAYKNDPEAYMTKYRLTDEQKRAVRDNDWLKMLELGGNIYFLAKLGVIEGKSVQQIDAEMTGVTTEEFIEMMRHGGRNPNG